MTGRDRHTTLFVAGLIVLLVAWWPTLVHLIGILWHVDVFAHGLVVPFVSLGLIWSRRELLKAAMLKFSVFGAGVLLAASALWLLGQLLDAALFGHIALVSALQGLVLLAYGTAVYRALLFPMLFLYFAVPVGYEIVEPLQHLTARLVIGTLDLFRVEYVAEGVLIELSSGLYEIAEACAGVKFFFTSIVTGVLLAQLVFDSWKRRVMIVAVAVVLPIAANALRVLGILLIAELTDQSFAKGVDHIIYGWVFLSIVLFALVTFAYKVSDKKAAPASDGLAAPPGKADPHTTLAGLAGLSMLLPAVASMLAPAPHSAVASAGITTPEPLFAEAPAGYRLLPPSGLIAPPSFLNADRVRAALLRRNGMVFLVSQARYGTLRPGQRLFQPGNAAVTGDWAEMAGLAVRREGPCGLAVREHIFRRGHERLLVWTLYRVNGEPVTSALQEKLHTAISRLTGGPALGDIVVLTTLATEGTVATDIFADLLTEMAKQSLLAVPGDDGEGTNTLCVA